MFENKTFEIQKYIEKSSTTTISHFRCEYFMEGIKMVKCCEENEKSRFINLHIFTHSKDDAKSSQYFFWKIEKINIFERRQPSQSFFTAQYSDFRQSIFQWKFIFLRQLKIKWKWRIWSDKQNLSNLFFCCVCANEINCASSETENRYAFATCFRKCFEANLINRGIVRHSTEDRTFISFAIRGEKNSICKYCESRKMCRRISEVR